MTDAETNFEPLDGEVLVDTTQLRPGVHVRLPVPWMQHHFLFSSFVISDVSETHATLDFNHPLAGESLTFAVTVVGVQPGNGEERRIIIPGEA